MRIEFVFAALCGVAFAYAGEAEKAPAAEPEVSQVVDLPEFIKSTISAPFLEQFTEGLKKWIPSTAKKITDGVEDANLLQYRGEWKVESPTVEIIKGDVGLVLKTLAAHSAISANFDKPLDPKGKTFVVQYEVKAQNGMECGGAYMKLLSFDKKFQPEKFSDKTPYTIMFGPDKCGSNNKVHFIFRHQNPETKEFEEKHLNAPPSVPSGTNTNLYTLIVNPDQSFEILINNESVKKGSLLKDFTPAVNPPETIPDPKETKPADWVEEKQIPDPNAKKPEDWDEDAPKEIVDESATKPEDWLENEPEYIADPEVSMPEDWDVEEDGDWTAPTIANPKCADVSGCGPWTKPKIPNPAYKGKWKAPMIDNPAYKGEWEAKQIPNPNYFKDEKPSDFTPMGAVGFELWTMQDGFIFDNIYIGHSIADAAKLADESWLIKKKAEDASEKAAKAQSEKESAVSGGIVAKGKEFFEEFLQSVMEFLDFVKIDPIGAVKLMPQVAITLLSILLAPLLFVTVLMGKKSVPPKETKKVEKVKEEPKETKDEVTASPEKEKKSAKRSPKKE